LLNSINNYTRLSYFSQAFLPVFLRIFKKIPLSDKSLTF
jgi:hypothetical protein